MPASGAWGFKPLVWTSHGLDSERPLRPLEPTFTAESNTCESDSCESRCESRCESDSCDSESCYATRATASESDSCDSESCYGATRATASTQSEAGRWESCYGATARTQSEAGRWERGRRGPGAVPTEALLRTLENDSVFGTSMTKMSDSSSR